MNPALTRLAERVRDAHQKGDVYLLARVLVDLGKHYLTTDRGFCPEVHVCSPQMKRAMVVIDQSKGSTLDLMDELCNEKECWQAAAVLRSKRIDASGAKDCLVVAVRDGEDRYSLYTPYTFDENRGVTFESTVETIELPKRLKLEQYH